jgi:predicted RNase H-like nuclease (RuvC/YqgF family)
VPINTSVANQYAEKLRSYETQLTQAKTNLRAYQTGITSGWQSAEVSYINRAIEQVLAQITAAQNQIAPIAQEIKNTAEQIRREEEAAAALAQKQAQIREVRTELEAAQRTAEEQKKKLDEQLRIAGVPAGGLVGAFTGAVNQTMISTTKTLYEDAVRRVDELQRLLNQISG